MLNCRQLVKQADLLLAGELPWQSRLAIRLHLVMCHHCRRYVRQLRVLIRAIPTMHGRASDEEVTGIMGLVGYSQDNPH